MAGVVRRLGAVKAEPNDAAELAIRARRRRSSQGEVASALTQGRLIKTFVFRGATHLLTPETGGAYLALRASSRMWELPSWQDYYGLVPSDWSGFRETVRDSLADGPLTFEELGAAITRVPRFKHLDFVFRERNWTLIKPLAWQGDLCIGSSEGRATLQSLTANPHWRGLPEIDEAGRHAVEAYLRAYGPATTGHLSYWLGSGLGAGGRKISAWLASLGDRVAAVDVEGHASFAMSDDVEDLVAAGESHAVRLLPAHDQWIIGPGTADANIVPPLRRGLFSGHANIVIAGGVVSGTWTSSHDQLSVQWFKEAGRPPDELISVEGERLAAILGRPLQLSVSVT